MRELTFGGFLIQYVRQLSEQKTNSLYKLAAEAGSSTPRLQEPLLLYVVYSQRQDVLLLATEYHKVWRSYQSRKNRGQADNHTKELMRKKVSLETARMTPGYVENTVRM